MDAFEILVTILSIALALFLLLAIVFTVYLIRIARRVQDITEKARAAASSVQAAAKIFERTAAPAVFSRIVANVVEGWQSSKKRKEKA
jgi:hypothetical protein